MSDKKTENLFWEEKFISKFIDEVAARKKICVAARDSSQCPACGAAPGKPCGYIAFDAHFGEDLPDDWVHHERREAKAKSDAAAVAEML